MSAASTVVRVFDKMEKVVFESILEKLDLETNGSALPMSLDEQETVYAAAFGNYELGSYAEASSLFTALVLANPFQESHWRGLASSRQMEEKYQEALQAWSMVALLAEHDPLPHFHAAECLLTLRNAKEALKALNCAETRLSKEEPALRSKIELLKATYG